MAQEDVSRKTVTYKEEYRSKEGVKSQKQFKPEGAPGGKQSGPPGSGAAAKLAKEDKKKEKALKRVRLGIILYCVGYEDLLCISCQYVGNYLSHKFWVYFPQ